MRFLPSVRLVRQFLDDFTLSQHEKKLKTTRQHKKDIHFPKRKYAVKAD